MINLVVLPYRDSYFYDSYGPAVRDLQFLEVLAGFDVVHKVTILNRPVSVLERLLLKKPIPKCIDLDKTITIDQTSKDFFGAIKGRAWAEDVYAESVSKVLNEHKMDDSINVVLDFLPIGRFEPKNLDGWVYWYDFIDNFVKHNRFSQKEKDLVNEKYKFVSSNATIVTSVSEACLDYSSPYQADLKYVLSNKVFIPSASQGRRESDVEEYFDFGFIGFVTDKFDVDIIRKISKSYSVAIYGKVLDTSIGKALKDIDNVSLMGSFSYHQLPQICSRFKVGLLPYIESKSHDGSPLKLYEYMKYNIPCLTSIDYEVNGEFFIKNYVKSRDLKSDLIDLISISGNSSISDSIKDDWLLEHCLRKVTSDIIRRRDELVIGR